MPAYYNEINPKKAAALRQLIAEGFIAAGEVDERSVTDVKPSELAGFTQCHFFAGIGLWSVALRQAMWSDDRPVWTGSCPCQPYSAAAGRRAAQQDERHLWPHWYRLIKESRPATIFGEQVEAAIAYGWLDDAFLDLETEDYACAAAVLPAIAVGKGHERKRVFFVADASSIRSQEPGWPYLDIAQTSQGQNDSAVDASKNDIGWLECPDGYKRPIEPGICLLADGNPQTNAFLHSAGDGIVIPLTTQFIKACQEAVA